MEQGVQLLVGGRAHGMEHRPLVGGTIDPIEKEAMQVNIQMIPGIPCPSPRWGQPAAVQNRSRRFCRGGSESLDEGHGASLCLGACQAGLFGQKGGDGAVDHS